jgi:hypothetical protein
MTTLSWEEFSALLRNPAAEIALYLTLWKHHVQHPAYAWRVTGISIKHGIPMPLEITDYLGGVAARMDAAEQESDLRAALPKIMGFPAKKKKGRGKPFDPGADLGDLDDMRLAILFATELRRGHSVPKALKNATAKLLPAHFGSLDERSLKKRIAKAVCREIMPRTAAEWRTELHSRIVRAHDLLHQLYLTHQSRELMRDWQAALAHVSRRAGFVALGNMHGHKN